MNKIWTDGSYSIDRVELANLTSKMTKCMKISIEDGANMT